MKLRTTRVYEENAAAYLDPEIDRAHNEGGTSSTKTFSILQLLILIAQNAREQTIISVVSESRPHLKKGAIRDFFNILGESERGNPNWNMTEYVYRWPHAVIEFFGADEAGKVHGPRRHILFLNETNNIPWPAAQALDLRTTKFVFLDWNPVSEFWAHAVESDGKSMPGWRYRPRNAYIHSTYLDGLDVVPTETIAKIEELRETDANSWRIYGEGLMGKAVGLVYPTFTQVPAMPEVLGLEGYGLDFGFTTDFSVLTHNSLRDRRLTSRQLFYQMGMTNHDIAQAMIDLGVRRHHDEIWADSAEPKSIQEIADYGFNIKGVLKGPGSVEHGHQLVLQYRQAWTADSLECIKEQRNFRYIPDKDGRLTTKTTHRWSHGMDSRRYWLTGALAPVEETDTVVYDAVQGEGVDMDLR